jgi:hypothetical protein
MLGYEASVGPADQSLAWNRAPSPGARNPVIITDPKICKVLEMRWLEMTAFSRETIEPIPIELMSCEIL